MITEAECLAGLAVRIACSGARPWLAREGAERLIAEGATALMSFGIAGGLVPGLEPGALLLPPAVIAPESDDVFPVDKAWHARVMAAAAACGLPLVTTAPVVGLDRAVTTVAEKAALARTTGASAVDMESHVVAAVAREHGVPLLVLRAIADPARRTIPAPALVGLGPEGEARPLAVALRLLAAPWTLLALMRLAADSRAGLVALDQAVQRLGPAALLSG
jgi:hopanoid-associated phosphorylase